MVRRLLEERLIACANVGQVSSIYRWEGEVKEDDEVLIVMKTQTGMLEELESRVQDLHPYDLPEFVALPVYASSRKYFSWVEEEVL